MTVLNSKRSLHRLYRRDMRGVCSSSILCDLVGTEWLIGNTMIVSSGRSHDRSACANTRNDSSGGTIPRDRLLLKMPSFTFRFLVKHTVFSYVLYLMGGLATNVPESRLPRLLSSVFLG